MKMIYKVKIQTKVSTSFPVLKCDYLSASMNELITHINSYNLDNLAVNNEDLYTCGFCGLRVGTLGGLRSHIRSLHKEMLPT
jgi:hypothetical protein